MAVKIPLVLTNGQLEQLQSGDSIGGGFSTITATLDFIFGSEEDTVVNTVSSALLTSSNFKGFSYIPIALGDVSLDDFKLNGVDFNIENIINSTSFDIRATAINNATGTYRITYFINYG